MIHRLKLVIKSRKGTWFLCAVKREIGGYGEKIKRTEPVAWW
ncbi:MAG: hypothetical protein QME73_01050 [Bacillota bacterium]|nr:hypothetical protein [Bacillota bacterium]